MAEGVSIRITRLNQLLSGKTPGRKVPLLDKETLLDAFMVLYNECNNEYMTKDNKNIATYVKKFKPLISDLEKLRLKKSDFEIRKTIGRGHFGEVHVVREKVTGNVYAMKVLKKDATLSQDNVAFFEEERDIMAFASNPWITSLQYAFQDFESLYFVMDFHPGGDLLSLLAKYDDVFEEDVAKFYLAEMIMAMHAVHVLGYVHRDIKPENVLVDRLGHIKLADFGSSAKLSSAKTVVSKMPVGTPEYIAPEVLMSMDGSGGGGKYGIECDWWSLGVVAYEMMIGNTPFQADSVVVVYSQIMNFKNSLVFPDDEPLTDNAKHLIRSLLTDQNNRIGYSDLAKHPFFTGLDWTTLQNDVPPYVPNIQREDDTSNFDEFSTESSGPRLEDFMEQKKGFVGKDLPFIGFTFTKQLTLASLTETADELAPRQSVKKAKSIKRDANADSSKVELINVKADLDREQKKNKELKHQIEEKMKSLSKIVQERDSLASEKLLFDTEKQDLDRRLNSEKSNREKLDKEVQLLRKEIEGGSNKEIQTEQLKAKYEEQRQLIQELENEKLSIGRSVQHLEKDLIDEKQALEDYQTRVNELQGRLTKANKEHNNKVSEMQQNLKMVTSDSETRIKQIQEKLNKSIDSARELNEQLMKIEKEKHEMEKQVNELKKRSLDTEEKSESLELLHKDLEEKKALCEQLQKNAENIQEDLEESERKYDNLVEFGEELKAQVERKIEKLQKELSSSKKENKKLAGDYQKIKEQLDEGKNLLNEKDMKISALQVSCDSLEKELNDIMNNKEMDSKEVDEKIKEERMHFTRQLSMISSEKVKYECDIVKLTNEVEESQQNVLQVKEQLEEVQKQFEETVESYESMVNKLNRDLTKVSDECNKHQKEYNTSRKSYDELKSKYMSLQADSEKALSDAAKIKHLESDVKKGHVTIENLKAEKRIMEGKYNHAYEDLGKVRKEKREINDELNEKERLATSQELTIHMLKQTCTMLEGQVEDLEVMNDEYQDRESQWNMMKRQLYQAQERLEQQCNDALASAEQQRSLKSKAEEKLRDMEDTVYSSKHHGDKRVEELEQLLANEEEKMQEMVASLSTLGKKDALNAITIKNLEKKLASQTEESDRLTSEVSHLTELSSQQSSSNFQLTVEIENLKEAMDDVIIEKENLQNEFERLHSSHAETKIKMESTLAQQTKLIDFLQKKVMGDQSFQPGKKQKFNFGKGKHPDPSNLTTQPDQRKTRDLEKALEKEKNAGLQLHLQLQKARDELTILRNENQQLKSSLKVSSISNPGTPQPNLKQSMAFKASPSSPFYKPPDESPPTSVADIYQMAENEVRGGCNKASHEDEFPHSLQVTLNMRSGKCPVCLNSVPFAKQISKCTECKIACHSSCAQSLPSNCGSPAIFGFSSVLMAGNNSVTLDDGTIAVEVTDGVKLPKIEGWLKYPRKSGTKQNWERKWVVLHEMKLSIYDNENTIEFDPFDEIDLNINEGELNIHPAIPASELIWSSANDIQYVFSIELLPYTLGWPRRTLYFLAPTFSDKQKWVFNLEYIGDEIKRTTQKQGHGMSEDVILTLEKTKLILNCAAILNETGAIMGCEDGLYVVSFKAGSLQNKPVHIVGLGPVFQMKLVRELGISILITGKERLLCCINIADLESRLKQLQTGSSISAISSHQIEKVKACHLFLIEKAETEHYLCAATTRKLNILKFQTSMQSFALKKEVETTVAATCLLLSSHFAIFGTNKFYIIDLKSYQKRDLLDASDVSLAFAVFGTSQTQSFPMAIFNVGESKTRDEYLLCYNQFGIFVDWQGRRSRKGDLKWSRLPLAFDYHRPYLYISHFASIEICEIPGDVKIDISTIARRFVDVPDPRFLGTGLSLWELLFSSSQKERLEIISYQPPSSQITLSRNVSAISGMSNATNSSGFESFRSGTVNLESFHGSDNSSIYSSNVSVMSDNGELTNLPSTPSGKRKEQLKPQEKDKRISFRFFKQMNRRSQNYDG